jgi:hypothetical protein
MAHRGGRFWSGTGFSYISEAIRGGADIIELDIRCRDGAYVVQHALLGPVAGGLEEALKRLQGRALYVHLKGRGVDPNLLVEYIRARFSGCIIVGSFDARLLRSVRDPAVIKACHCFLPWRAVAKGRATGAHWISPVCYFVTGRLAREIRQAGFAFVPSANFLLRKREVFGNQLRCARAGAYAVSTYHVREMRRLLHRIVGREPGGRVDLNDL